MPSTCQGCATNTNKDVICEQCRKNGKNMTFTHHTFQLSEMVNTSAVVDSSTVSYACLVCAYTLWRLYTVYEINRIHILTEEFVRSGYVVISGVSTSRKKKIWETVLGPVLQSFWRGKHLGFDITEPKTWPRPVGGKAYGDTFTGKVPGLPNLMSENYEAQAVLAYFCSGPLLNTMTFGSQTHWRLKLLINPLWALGLASEPAAPLLSHDKATDQSRVGESCRLVGKEQSWHLVNWPASPEEGDNAGPGCPVQNGAHIDAGM